jgi:hypothetical protein
LQTAHPDIPKFITERKELSDDIKTKLNAAIVEFKQRFKAAA